MGWGDLEGGARAVGAAAHALRRPQGADPGGEEGAEAQAGAVEEAAPRPRALVARAVKGEFGISREFTEQNDFPPSIL